jgi:phytoene desaturase
MKMRGWRSIYRMAASHLKHPKLRMVLSFHPLLIGGNPFSVTCVYSLINTLERRFGVHWAMGGTGKLIEGLVGLLRGLGGQLRLNAEVKQITVEPGAKGRGRARGVVLANGERIAADAVVSQRRHRLDLPPPDRRRSTAATGPTAASMRGRYSMSLFVWYFGTNRALRRRAAPHHAAGPRYEELLRDIFKRQVLAPTSACTCTAPPPPTRRWRRPAATAFYVLSPVPHLGSGTDWAQESERYRQAIAQALETPCCRAAPAPDHIARHHAAGLSGPPAVLPGAAFGLEPLLLQSAWFRPHNRSEDIDGLFMVGASTHPGAGVPGVLMSAKALESVLPPVHAARA